MDAEAKVVTGLNFELGSVIAHRYEIRERLGAGGVGMVYRAIDRDLDEVIALKLLLPHLAQDENVYRRFRNEVLVARSLSHPNIVRTHDMGRAEGGYSYISMEYVDGVSLKDKLVKQSKDGVLQPSLAFDEALSILYQVISGVAYAHGKGVIHRDLKPANVMLSKAGEVKLADFGTARIMGMDTTLTQTGQVIGTPDYMSPEQIRGEQLDTSCDVYALGIVAYELVTGQRPFTAESSVAVAFKHLNDPLPSFSVPGRVIPLWFEEVTRKAAAKKKAERFASVMEFAAALLDYAPQLSVQSTFFSVDRTLFPTTTGTQHIPAGGTAAVPVQGGTQIVEGRNRQGSGEFRFELGASSAPEEEGWHLGSAQPPSGDTIKQVRSAGSGSSGLVKFLGYTFGTLVALIVLLAIAGRVFPGTASLSPALSRMQQSSPVMANLLSSLLGVALKEPMKETTLVASSSSSVVSVSSAPSSEPPLTEEQRLTAELEGTSSSSVSSAQVSSAQVSSAQSSSVQMAASSSEPRQASSVSESPSSVAASSSEPKVLTPEVTPLHFTGTMALREGGRTVGDGSLSIDKLSQTKWQAALHVSGNAPLSAESVKNEFAINVFDLRKSSVIVKLKPEEVALPQAGDPMLKVSGSLRSLASARPGAGSFRMDLIRAGEVISSSDLILYKATVSVGAEQGQGEETIRIVTSSTIPETRPEPTPTASSVLPEVIRPPEPSLELSNGNASTSPMGLPLAKGHENSSVLQPGVRDSQMVTTQTTPPPPLVPEVQAVNENFGGWIRVSPNEGAPEEQRVMILNLQFSGVTISGNANIAGYDAFNVTGKVFARGMELELRNGQYWIRLTSGPRDRMLRGLYSFPALRLKGKWEASRSN